ncbi:MAG: putative nucleotide-diphospho-sugar transferase [Pseudomonadota bacterium]
MDYDALRWPDALAPVRREIADRLNTDLGRIGGDAYRRSNATLLLSIATKEFLPILKLWLKQAKRLKGVDTLVVGCDEQTRAVLQRSRVRSVAAHIPDSPAEGQYRSATGFDARGLLSTALKFPAVLHALSHYEMVVLCDLDGLPMKEPTPFVDARADIAFQREWYYPKVFVNAWGLAACTGFVCFRNTEQGVAFTKTARALNEEFYSDQLAFNLAIERSKPDWHWPDNPTLPIGDQRVFAAAAAQDIFATAGALRLQALRVDRFYRHNWVPIDVPKVAFYHPNTKKDVSRKVQILTSFTRRYWASRLLGTLAGRGNRGT